VTLSAAQRIAISHLAAGRRINDTAALINCHESTIDGWLRSEEFRAELEKSIDLIFEFAISQSAATISNSMSTLEEIRDDENSSNRDRIKASEILLNNAWKRRDLRLEERLKALESKVIEHEYQ
jgi:hypothetical protein